MADLENLFKHVRDNGNTNLGLGGKSLPKIPTSNRPIDLELLGPLSPGSPDPIDQRPINLPYQKPHLPPKSDYPITPISSPISPPFIPPSPIGPFNSSNIASTMVKQDLNPALQQTVYLRKKKVIKIKSKRKICKCKK